jgi:hypothetical protein
MVMMELTKTLVIYGDLYIAICGILGLLWWLVVLR